MAVILLSREIVSIVGRDNHDNDWSDNRIAEHHFREYLSSYDGGESTLLRDCHTQHHFYLDEMMAVSDKASELHPSVEFSGWNVLAAVLFLGFERETVRPIPCYVKVLRGSNQESFFGQKDYGIVSCGPSFIDTRQGQPGNNKNYWSWLEEHGHIHVDRNMITRKLDLEGIQEKGKVDYRVPYEEELDRKGLSDEQEKSLDEAKLAHYHELLEKTIKVSLDDNTEKMFYEHSRNLAFQAALRGSENQRVIWE